MQNWYFIAEGGKIHCYIKAPNPLIGFMFSNLGRIDIGIAICHLAAESEDFHFTAAPDAPAGKGHVYVGTV